MKIEHFINKKSKVVLEDGSPKLPSADAIEWGELAINYAKGHETISIKNDNNEIVTFSPDTLVKTLSGQVIDDEFVITKTFEKANKSLGFDEHYNFQPNSDILSASTNVTEALDTLGEKVSAFDTELEGISQLLSEILGEPTDTLNGKVTRILGE